ncbi:hypothetical protein EE612_057382, partial [Oryza sativa]
GGDASLCME